MEAFNGDAFAAQMARDCEKRDALSWQRLCRKVGLAPDSDAEQVYQAKDRRDRLIRFRAVIRYLSRSLPSC